MVKGSQGPHHFFRRKVREKEDHPWKSFLDRIIIVVGILGPTMTLPQVFKIWMTRNAAGVSLISWMSYMVFDSVWLAYGIVHKEKPIMVAYTIWLILGFFIVAGTFLYGTGFF